MRANYERQVRRIRVALRDSKLENAYRGRDEDEGVRKRSNSASGQPLPVNFSYLELQEPELKDFACDP